MSSQQSETKVVSIPATFHYTILDSASDHAVGHQYVKFCFAGDIDLSLCTLCGQCAALCPGREVEMGSHGPTFVRPSNCSYCADCEALCPSHAIRCEFTIVDSLHERHSEGLHVR